MRAVVQDVYGDSEVLRVDDVPVPEPGAGEVRVAIRAAGVTMGDWHLMTGSPEIARLALGRTAPKQRVRGMEASGVIEALGAGVTRFAIGDEVFGWISGSFADQAVVAEGLIAPKPAAVSHEDAATVTFGGSTALHAVRALRITAGDEVLVIGAGGGVGVFATQLAVAAGARVTGVCSAGKAQLVRSLGAVEVVDYRVDDLTRFAGRFAGIVDIAGARPIGMLRRLARKGGTVALVGAEGGGRLVGELGRNLRAMLLAPFVPQRFATVMAPNDGADVEELRRLLEAGSLRSPVGARYPLEQAPRALDDLAAGRIAGKAVVVP
jgi:NADPH:quinone reductase-like Zn-dependent oxidoreductase